jgi:hypothetical protein
MALAWPQGKKRISITLGGQFATLGANVVVIKIVVLMNPHFMIKISPKPNPVFSPSFAFYLSSLSSPFVGLICLFVNDERGFYFFYLKYGHGKHKSYKNLVFMFTHGGLTFKV